MLILPVPEDLHKLFEDRGVTSVTSLRKLRRVMEMTEDLPIVLVVTILRSKNGRTYGTGEVIDVVFAIQGCNI